MYLLNTTSNTLHKPGYHTDSPELVAVPECRNKPLSNAKLVKQTSSKYKKCRLCFRL